MKTIKMHRFESTGRARKVTPRMMEYLGHVIDTPLEGNREEGGLWQGLPRKKFVNCVKKF